jgi:hypothetical protein
VVTWLTGIVVGYIDKLEAIENEKKYSELDNTITTKEISDAISSLQNNKASSFDSHMKRYSFLLRSYQDEY